MMMLPNIFEPIRNLGYNLFGSVQLLWIDKTYSKLIFKKYSYFCPKSLQQLSIILSYKFVMSKKFDINWDAI